MRIDTHSLRATTGSTGHRYRCSTFPTTEKKITPLPNRPIMEKKGRRHSCSRDEAKPPASVRPGDSQGKIMRLSHAPTSSHRRPIGRVHGAGFDRRLLSLRQVYARRLRPAGRLTCRDTATEQRNITARASRYEVRSRASSNKNILFRQS